MNINANIGKTSGREHWTTVERQKLFLWQKARTGTPARGTILFVHGSSMASTPGFDPNALRSSTGTCSRRLLGGSRQMLESIG